MIAGSGIAGQSVATFTNLHDISHDVRALHYGKGRLTESQWVSIFTVLIPLEHLLSIGPAVRVSARWLACIIMQWKEIPRCCMHAR
jgi:hypothetical protein